MDVSLDVRGRRNGKKDSSKGVIRERDISQTWWGFMVGQRMRRS
jgi:hypothetical protein